MKKLLLLSFVWFSQFFMAQSDCQTAIAVCGNSNISYTPSGSGNVQETLGGCLSSNEHFSVWYKFTAATAGTLTFEIVPNANADYDWAVYGPNVNCNNLGQPIRCSYDAPPPQNTGLSLTATNTTDSASGTGYCMFLTVQPGETYYLIVDNFSANTNGFGLTWGGTATLASSFDNPGVQPFPIIAPGPNHDGVITMCATTTTYDFSQLSTGIINNNPNFVITYHSSTNDALTGANPIPGPITINIPSTYYYSIHYEDPNDPNNAINSCRKIGPIKFVFGNITLSPATVTACNNNNSGIGTFNLNNAAVINDPTVTKKFYPTMADLNAGTNEITNPNAYQSAAPKQVFVKVTTLQNCTNSGPINLEFYPSFPVNEASLISCFIENTPTKAVFNLTTANVTTLTGAIIKYYPTSADAINNSNEILNPTTYISETKPVYAKVFDANGCYNLAKINLTVTPPAPSAVLVDKVICNEKTTTLDAGPGYTAYEWSTGATTQSITNVGVGNYWVNLTKDNCVTKQNVKVIASASPIISGVDINNNTITINATSGIPPYQYSMDGINWQASNIYTGVPRGLNMVYVKDSFDCIPVSLQITVPNLLNAITPNNDGVNDEIDYSALAYKDNLTFTVFDRYGKKVATADKSNGYKWDGKFQGKKLNTGTYWYVITWNESDANKTPVAYTGWILLKNKD